MNALTLGVATFVTVSAVLGLLMVNALMQARREGTTGQALLGRLLPFLIADAAFVILFAVWLVTNL